MTLTIEYFELKIAFITKFLLSRVSALQFYLNPSVLGGLCTLDI